MDSFPIGKNSIFIIVGKLIFSGLGLKFVRICLLFLATSVLAKNLTVEAFGQYSLILSLATIGMIVAISGLPNFVMREGSKYQIFSNRDLFKSLRTQSLKFSILFSFITTLILISGTLIFYWGNQKLFWPLIFIFAFLPTIQSVAQTSAALLRACGRSVRAQTAESLVFPLIYFFLLMLILWLPRHLDLFSVLGAYVLAMFFSMCFSCKLLQSTFAEVCYADKPNQIGAYCFSKQSIYPIFFFALYEAAGVLFYQIDTLMIAYFLQIELVGIYRIALQFASLVVLIVGVANAMTMPMFSDAHISNDNNKLFKIFQTNRFISFVGSGFCSIFLIVFFERITELFFGPEYFGAKTSLMVLALGHMLNIVLGPVGAYLLMTGREYQVCIATLISLILCFISNLILIPSYGLLGAASSTALSIVICKIIMIISLSKNELIQLILFKGKLSVLTE